MPTKQIDIDKLKLPTIAEFRFWLESKNPQESIGIRGDCGKCPIHTYLVEHGFPNDPNIATTLIHGTTAVVCGRMTGIWREIKLKSWIVRFIDMIDSSDVVHITAGRAISVLKAVIA